jgi:hypothetical protein
VVTVTGSSAGLYSPEGVHRRSLAEARDLDNAEKKREFPLGARCRQEMERECVQRE